MMEQQPLAPPLMEELPPPSYSDYEQEELTAIDTDPMESQKLIEEQKLIFEQLAQEKADNDAAIAAAVAEGLELDIQETTDTTNNTTDVSATNTINTTNISATNTSTTTNSGGNSTITIGPNTRVQLRGEEVTMSAISRGEAMVVQCLACHNWMQIANTARLMFCPVCSTISRAEPQTHMTLEDAKQAMAEKRREEKRRKREQVRNMTWGQYVKSFFKEEEEEVVDSSVSERPATASVYGNSTETERTDTASTTRQPLISVQTGEEETTRELPAARIAEKKPLMSCVSNLGKYLVGGGGDEGDNGRDYNRDMLIDGVDSTSLLSVTRAGRYVD